MKKKVLTVLLASALAVSTLAACGTDPTANNAGNTTTDSQSDADVSTGDVDASDKVVGIAMPTKSLERWNRDGQYIDTLFQEAGYGTELVYSDNDPSKQVSDIQNLIAQGVDLLVIAAIDGEALNTAMDEAAEAGIPVISYDRLIANDAVSYYVSFDNYTVGTLQGEYIVETLGLEDTTETFNIEFTAGDPADNNAGYFFNGAYDVLKPYIEAGTLVVVSGQTEFDQVATPEWKTENALSRAQNILGSNYSDGTRLDAWVCSNDSTALGVAQAITSDYAGDNAPIITGQDGDIANLANIVDGVQSMTVYKNVLDEAVVTVAIAEAIFSGAAVDDSLCGTLSMECVYDTTSYFTSEGNYCPSFLLVPTVVTADNLDYLVEIGLYEMDADGYLQAAEL